MKHPELLTTDKTRKAITFHDPRATGLTWMAIRDDEPLRIATLPAGRRTKTDIDQQLADDRSSWSGRGSRPHGSHVLSARRLIRERHQLHHRARFAVPDPKVLASHSPHVDEGGHATRIVGVEQGRCVTQLG